MIDVEFYYALSKRNRRLKYLISFSAVLVLLSLDNLVSAQQFSGFRPFKKLVEFESQRFLLSEVYEVPSESWSELKVEKIIEDYDMDYGFMFVLAFYTFQDKSGVVISSFRETVLAPNMNSISKLVNVHLSEEEVVKMSSMLGDAQNALNKIEPNEKTVVRRFNDRLILEMENTLDDFDPTVIIWIDNSHRHSFSFSKWNRALRKYAKERK